MKYQQFVSAILLMSLLSGCQVFMPTSAPTQEIVPTVTAEAEGMGLSLNQFKNYSFISPSLNETVQLKDGKYETGSGTTYESLQLLDQAGFGDLNGDGNTDAAVLLAENNGGSGVFVYLVALVKQADGYAQSSPILIDDRPNIEGVSINNNHVHLEGKIHGTSDSMANPTMLVDEEYELVRSRLIITRRVSTISSAERSITIDAPTENSEVSSSFNVKGSMPIGPFENTLAYRFYDSAGILLVEQPLAVQSDGAGGPATINATVQLPNTVSSGANLLFVLAEQNMADGSDLCLNSVNLTVK